jgi:hypothetical protein
MRDRAGKTDGRRQECFSTTTFLCLLVLVVLALLLVSIRQTYVNSVSYKKYYYGKTCPLHGRFCPFYPEY